MINGQVNIKGGDDKERKERDAKGVKAKGSKKITLSQGEKGPCHTASRAWNPGDRPERAIKWDTFQYPIRGETKEMNHENNHKPGD